MTYDAIVLGAGPAGLGAALALSRDGAHVALVEASTEVGGLCRTLRRDDVSYDLGGHILFVGDERRRAWLEELVGDDAIWVGRPVVCIRDGRITRGRYLDQRPSPDASPNGAGPSAHDFLTESFGRPFVDAVMRRYLEKVDGMPLERILAMRARKLMLEQHAPEGFWYPAGGIGQLMDAMADEIRRRGGVVLLGRRVTAIDAPHGTVTGVTLDGPDGPRTLDTTRVIAGLPPTLVANLVAPGPPPGVVPTLAPRAAALVYLQISADCVTDHAWIQVDHPDVPFARLSEVRNWSEGLAPGGQTVLGCEVYCHPTDDDRWWALDDAALGRACAAALHQPLDLIDASIPVTTREVVRMPRAWSLVDVDELEAAGRPMRWLESIDGLSVAQGGDVILAIGAGEAAAEW